jgi:sulfate permease, SulP family
MNEEREKPGAVAEQRSAWQRMVPPLHWLPAYRWQWLRHDFVAGVTLAAYAIPVSLAYATLAGLPPHYGIYCYLVGGLAYALFGTSKQLAIGRHPPFRCWWVPPWSAWQRLTPSARRRSPR